MAGPASKLPPHSQRVVDEFIAGAATRIERVVCGIRAGLVSLNLVRIAWIWDRFDLANPGHAAWSAGIASVSLALSLLVLVRYRARNMPRPALWLSVAHDLSLAFVALLANPVWPGPGYRGLLEMPDAGILLLVVAASGLRLSKGVAAFASLLACAAFYTLIALDLRLVGLGGPGSLHHQVFWWALFGTASAFSVLTAGVIRSLVRRGAIAALQSERAERSLGALMRDHHDVRTQLSAAALNADMLARSLAGDRPADADEMLSLTRDLRADIAEVNEYIVGIRERAHGEVTGLQSPLPADVGKTARRMFAELAHRFPNTSFEVAPSCRDLEVWIAGGESTLRRVLQNLAVNAAEGDGRRRARNAILRAEPGSEGRVRFCVADDGPGFPEAVLRAPIGARVSSKEAGSGLGFIIVEALLGADSESLERSNPAAGGACVAFELSRVRA